MEQGSLRIACIGGGTGLHAELSGLKEEFPDAQLSAVVTMMDSGSNSGLLRDAFGHLPPGDVRQCLVALSDAPHELRSLMQHRFQPNGSEKNTLQGHVVGNILLTALKEITGGEYEAIEAMERILRIRGKVYPVTIDNAHLVARLADGTTIKGEGNLYGSTRDLTTPITELALEPRARIFPKTRTVLESAHHIIIGPGGLHHSILPNLIVDGMRDALKAAKRNGARITLVTNTMTKHGDTTGFAASDILRRIQQELDGVRIDAVIVNSGTIPPDLLIDYAQERAEPVHMDLREARGGPIIVAADLVNDEPFLKQGKPSFARHHPGKLAAVIRETIRRLDTGDASAQAPSSPAARGA